MILVDPIARIGHEEFAHRARTGTVEIDRLPPVVVVAISEISWGEQFEIISVRAEMIIDDVKDDCDPEGVSAVNEAAEISRQTIEAGWCEEIDAVISPAEPARKFSHGHNFEAGNAEFGERRQLVRGRFPISLWGEGADMHLVDDELFADAPAPRDVGPSEGPGIDDFRRAVRPLRWKPRCRVGQYRLLPIESETIAHAGSSQLAPQREVPAGLGLQCLRLEAFDLDDNFAAARRPEAEIDPPSWLRLGADWQAPD